MEMVSIKTLSSFYVGGYIVNTQFNIRQYYELSNVFVTREEDCNKNNYLFAYGYNANEYKVMWSFPHDHVIGIRPLRKSMLPEGDIFYKYMIDHEEKEFLEVYAGEFRYIVDVNTGAIIDKMDSR